MISRRHLHDVILDTLEFQIFDRGDAAAIVGDAFDRVIDILLRLPQFAGASRFDLEMLLRDEYLAAEARLYGYSLCDPSADAKAIVEAIVDAEPESADSPAPARFLHANQKD